MSSEANKEEIQKCIGVADAALQSGDETKAVKFLQKAERMGGTPATDMLERLKAKSTPKPASARSSTMPSSAGTPSTSSNPTRTAAGTRCSKEGKEYTAEQMTLVQKILRTKDYYQMLGIQKDANENDLKKAYKKAALKLHPDKNSAPGAEEAFKKLSKAFQCLNDPQNRAAYDQYGDEDRIPEHHRSRGHYHHDGDFMTPEDLFNSFFGGVVHPGARGRGHGRNENENGGRNPFLQFLPIFIILIFSLYSRIGNQGGNAATFSFKQDSHFRVQRESLRLKAGYYVTPDFHKTYPENSKVLREFERSVEIYYVQSVNSKCDFQESAMMRRLQMARRQGNEKEVRAAKNSPLPKCQELKRIQNDFPTLFNEALMGAIWG